jgi:hypothetical protein
MTGVFTMKKKGEWMADDMKLNPPTLFQMDGLIQELAIHFLLDFFGGLVNRLTKIGDLTAKF